MQEEIFYNAINIVTLSDYRELDRLKVAYGNWEEAWLNLPKSKRDNVNPEKEWGRVIDGKIELLLIENKRYPRLLREIPWSPFGVYVMGELPKTGDPTIAIVGTRKATEDGKEVAHEFAAALAKRGVAIVSGLAFGIDGAAHSGCLSANGKTLAVLGNGLHRFYPTSHERLAKNILNGGGAMISEYPLGAVSFPSHFLERNRIVSGLSQGTLVIEAPRESGSLVTARFALEQNRLVFVTSGPIKHPNFEGSHELIRAGAELVTSPDHVLEALGLWDEKSTTGLFSGTKEEEIILGLIKSNKGPLTIDKIIELTHLKTPVVSQTLSFLLIHENIRETAGGYTIA